MQCSTQYLLAAFALLCCFAPAWGIFCFNCSSTEDKACKDPFDSASSKFLVNCTEVNPEAKFCRKIDQTVNSEHRVFRRCAWEDHPRHDCYFGTAEYYKSKICICRHEKCNDGATLTSSVFVLIATVCSYIFVTNSRSLA